VERTRAIVADCRHLFLFAWLLIKPTSLSLRALTILYETTNGTANAATQTAKLVGWIDQGKYCQYIIDVAKEAIIQGQVLRGSSAGQTDPVSNAYVRLLDRTGEFTAEVPTSATGHFRFFAGPGDWTLRTLAPKTEPVDTAVTAEVGSIREVAVQV